MDNGVGLLCRRGTSAAEQDQRNQICNRRAVPADLRVADRASLAMIYTQIPTPAKSGFLDIEANFAASYLPQAGECHQRPIGKRDRSYPGSANSD